LNRLRHGFAGDGGREIGEIEIEISGQLALRRMKAEISKCESVEFGCASRHTELQIFS
jgi:hypothetical protein